MGLCKNIDNDIGDYYLDIDFECPNVDDSWKDMKNNKTVDGMMKEIKDRITVGRRIITSSIGGIFGTPSGNNKRRKIRMCLEWKKIPYRNQWTCLKFFPPKKPVVKEDISSVKDQCKSLMESVYHK